jgi:hypothetical protein
VVEEGTFERVMEFEAGKIKALKDSEVKRKTIGLRGGAVVPIGKEGKKEICKSINDFISRFAAYFALKLPQRHSSRSRVMNSLEEV